MANSLLNNFTKDQILEIINSSNSYAEAAKQLGFLSTHGNTIDALRNYTIKENISTEHFHQKPNKCTKRTDENTLIEGSTASQSTVRRKFLAHTEIPYICSICGLEPFWNGQELTLIMDHINGINNDDRLENLRWVCPNCNQQLPTTGYRKDRTKNKIHKEYRCCDCGKEISADAIRCPDCWNKYRTNQNYPDRDTLKRLIRTTPFTQIGKMYNVSDNAIRKLCIRENLPSKVREIKQYSDKEWDLL